MKSDWAALVKPWRRAASLIVGLMVLTLLGMGIEYAALRAEDRRLTAALEQECHRITSYNVCYTKLLRRPRDVATGI